MARKNRADLKISFSDGKRPTGSDFADLLDSFINPEDENLKRDGNTGNFTITLGSVPSANAGTLRFNAGKVQVSNGGAVWQEIGSGSDGGFQPVGGGPNIAVNGVNVGIALGNNVQPTAKLDINLIAGEQIKVGNGSIANGSAAQQNTAFFGHKDQVNGTNFALSQNATGQVRLNAAANQKIIISKGGNNPAITVLENNNVVIGSEVEILAGAKLQVNGSAIRADGETTWKIGSDIRLKKDIKPFKDGLEKLLKINPVEYKYNGKGNMIPDKNQIGIIGQEIAEVLPYTISIAKVALEENEAPSDVMFFDANALFYVLINSVKELSAKVDDLQNQLNLLKKV